MTLKMQECLVSDSFATRRRARLDDDDDDDRAMRLAQDHAPFVWQDMKGNFFATAPGARLLARDAPGFPHPWAVNVQ